MWNASALAPKPPFSGSARGALPVGVGQWVIDDRGLGVSAAAAGMERTSSHLICGKLLAIRTGAATFVPPTGHCLFLAHQMNEQTSTLTATAPAVLISQACTFEAPFTWMSVFAATSRRKLWVFPCESIHWPTILPLSLMPSRDVT